MEVAAGHNSEQSLTDPLTPTCGKEAGAYLQKLLILGAPSIKKVGPCSINCSEWRQTLSGLLTNDTRSQRAEMDT